MKKKIIIVSILCVLCIGLISGILFLDNKNVVLENEKIKKSKNNNQISMMFETAKDSNVYEVSSDNTFPISEYVFNETLSKCENGGIISWDQDNQKAVVKNNTSDKCYAYFDRYDLPKITSVDIIYSTNNITANIEAVAGTESILKYSCVIKDLKTLESTSSNMVLNGLNTSTLNGKTFDLYFYAIDSNNFKSTSYKMQITIPKVLDDLVISADKTLDISEYSYINKITFTADATLTLTGSGKLSVGSIVSLDGSDSTTTATNAKNIQLVINGPVVTVGNINSGKGGTATAVAGADGSGYNSRGVGYSGSSAENVNGGLGGNITINVYKSSSLTVTNIISGDGGNAIGANGGNGASGMNATLNYSSGMGGSGGNGSTAKGGTSGIIRITNAGNVTIESLKTGAGGIAQAGNGGNGGNGGDGYMQDNMPSDGGNGGSGGYGTGGNSGSIYITTSSDGETKIKDYSIGLPGTATFGTGGSGGLMGSGTHIGGSSGTGDTGEDGTASDGIVGTYNN